MRRRSSSAPEAVEGVLWRSCATAVSRRSASDSTPEDWLSFVIEFRGAREEVEGDREMLRPMDLTIRRGECEKHTSSPKLGGVYSSWFHRICYVTI